MNVPGKTRMSELKHVPLDVRSDDVMGGAFMESTRNREYVHRTHGRTSLQRLPSRHSQCVPWFVRPCSLSSFAQEGAVKTLI